jgi:hypothetical protein
MDGDGASHECGQGVSGGEGEPGGDAGGGGKDQSECAQDLRGGDGPGGSDADVVDPFHAFAQFVRGSAELSRSGGKETESSEGGDDPQPTIMQESFRGERLRETGGRSGSSGR